MKLKPEQLSDHLAKSGQSLAPIYLLSGDEPLLIQEAADQIRKAAKDAGFSERISYQADNAFSWELLLDEANSLSLFAERKLIELNILNGKPGTKGADALQRYCENISPDNLLVITSPRLDGNAQNSKWFKTLEKNGVCLSIWPVEADQLPRWIANRLRQQGIKATNEAASILAERVEGNLLAAVQEIEKLKLLVNVDQPLDEEAIINLVANSSRYDLFGLVDTALKGDAQRCLRMLEGLQTEGTEPNLLVWALSRDLRILINLKQENGTQPVTEQQFKRHRIWGKRKTYINQALQRHSLDNLLNALRICNQADKCVKGIERHSPWLLITEIILKIAR